MLPLIPKDSNLDENSILINAKKYFAYWEVEGKKFFLHPKRYIRPEHSGSTILVGFQSPEKAVIQLKEDICAEFHVDSSRIIIKRLNTL